MLRFTGVALAPAFVVLLAVTAPAPVAAAPADGVSATLVRQVCDADGRCYETGGPAYRDDEDRPPRRRFDPDDEDRPPPPRRRYDPDDDDRPPPPHRRRFDPDDDDRPPPPPPPPRHRYDRDDDN